jgi:hypothetical protein
MLLGLITEEAIAEPKNKANHTNTRLAISLELRRVCITTFCHIRVGLELILVHTWILKNWQNYSSAL